MTDKPRQRNMLGHLSFGVRDLGRATMFYDSVLAPLGYVARLDQRARGRFRRGRTATSG